MEWSGYWQIALQDEDKEKTEFSAGNGLYQFNVMPFGLCNVAATFERLVELVLRGLTRKICFVYLDGIVFGRTFDHHLSNLKEVFTRLRNTHLQLNRKIYVLLQQQVIFFWHVSSGFSTDLEQVKSFREWPQSKAEHEVESFSYAALTDVLWGISAKSRNHYLALLKRKRYLTGHLAFNTLTNV